MSRETGESIVVTEGRIVLLKVGKGRRVFAEVGCTPMKDGQVLVGIHPKIEGVEGASLIGASKDGSHVLLAGKKESDIDPENRFTVSEPNFFQVCLYRLGLRILGG